MKVTAITIVKGQGPDIVFMETDLPSGIWPYKGFQSVKTELAAGSAEEYVNTHFQAITVKVVDVPSMRLEQR